MALHAAPLRHLALVSLSYVLGGALGYAAMRAAPGLHPIASVALGDFVATVVVFAFSRAFNNSSFYDPYWSVAPMVIAPYLAFGAYADAGLPARKWIAIAAVTPWALRLTYNWIRGWEGLHHEDWRYVDFRKQWGAWYWPGSFGAIHLFPTVATFAGSLPFFVTMSSTRPVGPLDYFGLVVALAATVIEGVADEQLRSYRKASEASGKKGGVCEVGLWRYSRHPNYFGECGLWFGLWILGIAAEPSAWWVCLGALGILAMFVFGTIPLAENRALARRPEFKDHQRKVSMLVPWFRRS